MTKIKHAKWSTPNKKFKKNKLNIKLLDKLLNWPDWI